MFVPIRQFRRDTGLRFTGRPGSLLTRCPSAILLILVGVGACGEPPADPTAQDGPLYTEVACPALSLSATSALPLDEIPIGRLPDDFDLPVAARVTSETADSAEFAVVELPDSGDALLLVPLHPADPVGGGSVTLTFTDGTRACAPVAFTIEPLPSADGEFAAIVDLVQGILNDQATLLETTPDELRRTPIDDLPESLWPLAVLQVIVDDSTNDQSLRAVANGMSGDDARDLLDRLLARTDVRASLEQPPAAAATVLAVPAGTATSVGLCEPATIGNDAGLLDDCMAKAAEADRLAHGVSDKVAKDIEHAFAVADKLGLPLADVVKDVLGFMFWVVENDRKKTAALLPSYFTAMKMDVSQTTFLEDEAAQGSVSHAEVFAANKGWDLGKEIIDGFLKAADLAETVGDFSTGTPAADKLASRLKSLVEKRLHEMKIEDLVISPEGFGPVDVTEPPWIQARVALGDAIAIVSGTTYEPRRAGMATLSVRTKDGGFGGQQIAAQADILVETIQLQIDPADTHIAPGKQKTFTVTVEKATHPEQVAIDGSVQLQGEATIAYAGGSTHHVTYTAPAAPNNAVPDLLTVVDVATTGARASGESQDRNAIAVIHFASVTIAPRSGCVDTGDTLKFSVAVEGLDDEAVVWDASVGTITSDGLYTAPQTRPADGMASITATSVEDAGLADTVTVNIGCGCTFSLSIAGNTVTSDTGYTMTFYSPPDGTVTPDGILTQIRIDQPATGRLVSMFPDGSPAAPGMFSVDLSGSIGLMPPDFVYYTADADPPAHVTLSILDYTPKRLLRGDAIGSVKVEPQPPDSGVRNESFSLSFEIRIAADYTPSLGPFGYAYVCTIE